MLDGILIGNTNLECADPPMGIVFGKINFNSINSGYDFFENYCSKNEIEKTSDYPEDKLISTAFIPDLKVVDLNEIEIVGYGANIDGMDSDCFTITISGIPYHFLTSNFHIM